jgi:hypothetical protein
MLINIHIFIFLNHNLSIFFDFVGLAWGIIITCEYNYYINSRIYYNNLINLIVLSIGISICVTLYLSVSTKALTLVPDSDR